MNFIFSDTHSLYNKPAKELLVDLINRRNPGAQYSVDSFIWGKPSTSTRTELPFNTMLLLSGNPEQRWFSEQPIWYNRIDIAQVFTNSRVNIMPQAGQTMLSDLMAQINDLFGLRLTADDYVNTALSSTVMVEPSTVTLEIKPESLLFVGQVVLKIGNWFNSIALDSSIYVTYAYDQNMPVWITKLNADMTVTEAWSPVTSDYVILPSRVTSSLVLNENAQFLLGSLHYLEDGVAKSSVALIISDKHVYDLKADVIDGTSVLAHFDGFFTVNDIVVSFVQKGSKKNHALVQVCVAENNQDKVIALVDTTSGATVVAALNCAVSAGITDEIAPVFYTGEPDTADVQYVDIIKHVDRIVLTFLNEQFMPVIGFQTITVTPHDATRIADFANLQAKHFSFTAQKVNGEIKILLALKLPLDLFNKEDVDPLKAYSAFNLSFDGVPAVTPVEVTASGYSGLTAWFGAVEITAASAAAPSKFSSAVVQYSAAYLNDRVCEKTNAPLMFARTGQSGYSGLRFSNNPVYGIHADTIFPWNTGTNGEINLIGTKIRLQDKLISYVFDAKAEEVFFTDSNGVKHSRGFLWHVIGLSSPIAIDIQGIREKALTYVIFDVDGSVAYSQYTGLEYFAIGDETTTQPVSHSHDKMTAWLISN